MALDFAPLAATADAWAYRDDTSQTLTPSPAGIVPTIGLGSAGQEYGVGLRYTTRLPPQGATIHCAVIAATAAKPAPNTPTVRVSAIAADAAGQYSDWATWDAAARTTVTPHVMAPHGASINTWSVAAEVTAALQAIVSRAGYTAEAVVFDLRYDPDETLGTHNYFYADTSIRSPLLVWTTSEATAALLRSRSRLSFRL